jgi:hypothetical protein
MGTTAGHVVSGSFFILWGLWWMIGSISLHLWHHFNLKLTSTAYKETNLKKSSNIPICCDPAYKWPMEPVLKILLPFLAVLIELTLEADKDGKFYFYHLNIHTNDGRFNYNTIVRLHHIAMHSFFILSGFIDIFALCTSLPKLFPRVFLSFAFLIELYLFIYHSSLESEQKKHI